MSIVNILVGAITGVLSGFGIGGGSLLVLYLTAIGGVEQTIAGAINLLYFIGCAPAALVGHIKNKLVQWKTVIWCVIGGVPTAVLTALTVQGMETELLRRLFGLFLLFIGVREWRVAKQTK